jgi:hypothetical protein
MSNVCDTCSKLRDLPTLICGCGFNYRFNMWIDDVEKPIFFIWGGVVPDIFRKCFSTEIIDDSEIDSCKNICPYYYLFNDPTNFDLGYSVRTMDMISPNNIKALFFYGYSTPSFRFIESIDGTSMKLTNNDILMFNELVETFNPNVLTRKLSRKYLNTRQVTFMNYFNILYPSYTLISQYINFIFKALKTYQYFIEDKKLLCKTEIYWEYTLECNSQLRNDKNVKISETTLAQLYILLEEYLANKFVTYSYYQNFFDTIRYALQVYSDIYLIYLKSENVLQMPLYNKMNNRENCPRPYMSNHYKQQCRTIYNTYMTNKSKIYTNKALGSLNFERNIGNESFLANLVFVKVSPNDNQRSIAGIDVDFFKEYYPVLNYSFTNEFENDEEVGRDMEKYYFLESGENLNIDLSGIEGFLCWNYFGDIFLSNDEILKDFHYENKINLKINDNICIYIFYNM